MNSKTTLLRDIVNKISQCTACNLHKTRKSTVPGEGTINAEVFFIGEAPGKINDNVGRPFVGHGGKLFDTILTRCGFKREEVFITNAVKCWPPNNRKPRACELSSCRAFLMDQIKIIQPRCIITLGTVAYETLTDEKIALKTEHGKFTKFGSYSIGATFHPNGIRYIKGGSAIIIHDIIQILNRRGIKMKRQLNTQSNLINQLENG